MYTLYIDCDNDYVIFNDKSQTKSYWGDLNEVLDDVDYETISNIDKNEAFKKYNPQPIATFETKKDLDNIQKTHPELFI